MPKYLKRIPELLVFKRNERESINILAILQSMKNKINLLLIVTLSLLMMNCSGKPNQTKVPQLQRHQANLGRVISVPSSVKNPVVVEQTFKDGESFYSKRFKLPNRIRESSGLINVDNRLWTINDSGGKATLYQIDEQNGHIVKTLNIQNATNKDWEDIAYDENYVYIGDIGNNRGNRRDLKVYKLPRAALRTEKSIRAEIIYFSYSDQKDFKSRPQQTNYDCEAMIAYNEKLYLFSKNWQNHKTRLYELSSRPGKHQAKYRATFNTHGMVTGATINRELGILLLSAYSSFLNVNVWAFTNFNESNFFNGDVKQLTFDIPLQGQVEGITFRDNYKAYLSSEAFKKYIFSLDATLYTLDFSGEFE